MTGDSNFARRPASLHVSHQSGRNSNNSAPHTPLRRYFSRRKYSRPKKDLTYVPDGFIGMNSMWAWLWGGIFAVVPLSYTIIGLVCLRELMARFEPLESFVLNYLPPLYKVIAVLRMLRATTSWYGSSDVGEESALDVLSSSPPSMTRRTHLETASGIVTRLVEYWCWLEGLFYIVFQLYIHYLQRKDPLEASLSAAPLMDADTRSLLWKRMMECECQEDQVCREKHSGATDAAPNHSEEANPVTWLSGWFFDEPIDNISKYDMRDFVAWSMFEGRHQEHLTSSEQEQLEDFVTEAELRISLFLYGKADDDDKEYEKEKQNDASEDTSVSDKDRSFRSLDDDSWVTDTAARLHLTKPKKLFRFVEESHQDEPNFFSNLYETYKNTYEQMINNAPDFKPVQDLREMVAKADFHPVQDLKNLMAETAQQISNAEESAKATASHMYETLVPSGSQMEKHLSAMSHATYSQLTEAWNSVKNIQQRLETARFLSKQRQRIRQQLRGYRVMLNRMREMSSAVPSKQMAAMMRRITECNEALEVLESRAQSAFVQATGFASKSLSIFQKKEPRRYAKYSSDPLLGIATYPLGFNLSLFVLTEVSLRIMMNRRGFERRTVGAVSYYVHPGLASVERELSDNGEKDNYYDEEDDDSQIPIIFVHGIGIGVLVYMPLIDALLATGRPILLPEIPYITGFRPWQSMTALPPASVVSTMTAMLASHGYMRGVWLGHSYGTSWLSYMIKYAPHAVSAVCFLDPICFCLHVPRLTKQFVYTKPDPGTISYIVRTDVIVNWTIQRSFPWAWIVLFLEEIPVPCCVFLSEKDQLVPSEKIEQYFKRHHVAVRDFDSLVADHDAEPEKLTQAVKDDSGKQQHPLVDCTVFRGDGHGDWSERQSQTVPTIVRSVKMLLRRVEEFKEKQKQ